MTSNLSSLFEELKQLALTPPTGRNPRAYFIIHEFAEANYREAESLLREGLRNPDWEYRWHCISALVTHWGLNDPVLIGDLTRLARFDPELSVRDIAIDSLGLIGNPAALSTLQHIANDPDEDEALRDLAQHRIEWIVSGRFPD